MIAARSLEGALDRLYRRGTEPLAAFLARYPWVTANRTSITGFLVGGIGAAVCISTLPLWTAAIMVVSGDFLDYLDGDVARKRGTGSREGAILDAVLDRYTDVAAIGALVYLTADSFLLVGLAALLGAMLTPYVKAKTEAEGKSSVNTIGSRGTRNWILVAGLAFGQPTWTLAVIAVVANFSALHRLAAVLRSDHK